MAPSFATVGAAAVALAYTSGVAATVHYPQAYQVKETYDASNFFSNFNFFVSNFDTGNYNDVDPTSGFVNYRNQHDAKQLGLIDTQGSEVFLGVNHADKFNANGKGRDSVRLESQSSYTHGLFIADFTHLPQPVCGSWPAFWMYGPNWPSHGEFDIFETYNMVGTNTMTLHADSASNVGECAVTGMGQTGITATSNCDNTFSNPPFQYSGQGCGVTETHQTFLNPNGAVYAMEWSSQNISVWSWTHDYVPSDVASGKPNPRGWGAPSFYISSSSCDIDRVLSDNRLVLNLDFCGQLAGNQDIWTYNGCKAQTGYDTCAAYVAAKPDDFNDVFFKIASIKVYEYSDVYPTTTSTTSTASSTTSSSSMSSTSSYATTTSTSSSSSSSSTASYTSFSTYSWSNSSATYSSSSTSSPYDTSATNTVSYTSFSTYAPTTTYPSGTYFPTSSAKYPYGNSSATYSSSYGTGVYSSQPTYTSSSYAASSSLPAEYPTSSGYGYPTSSEYPVTYPTTSTTCTETYPLTTSTLYAVTTYTTTLCKPTVVYCPADSTTVVTATIPVGTTVCPVSESVAQPTYPTYPGSSGEYPSGHGYPGEEEDTYTTMTSTYYSTVTVKPAKSYPPTIIYQTATVVPVSNGVPVYPSKAAAAMPYSTPTTTPCTTTTTPYGTGAAQPYGTGAAQPYGTGAAKPYGSGYVVTAGAGKAVASLAVLLGAVAAALVL